MTEYTVIMARPNEFDNEFFSHVGAETVLEAQRDAQVQAWETDTPPDERGDPGAYDEVDSYRVIAVFEGHHYDCSANE